MVSAKYCYAAHESRLHQNDRCKRFTLCLVLTVRFRSLAPWGKLFQLFIYILASGRCDKRYVRYL